MPERAIMRDRGLAAEFFGSVAGWCHSFALAALATAALAFSTYSESFEKRLSQVLVVLLLLHGFRFRRLLLTRELALYGCFFAYLLLELLWTDDIALAMNTLVYAFDCVLIL